MGGRSLGRVALGGERFCTYGTMAYVTLGRRSRRSHWHGIDPDTKTFFNAVYSAVGGVTALNTDVWSRRVVRVVDKLVKELKAGGFWDLCNIVYPFAAYNHYGTGLFGTGYNLKSPSTFVIAWGGAEALHNEYGTTFNNGISSGTTGFNPGTALGTNNWHACAYVNYEQGMGGTLAQTLTSANATGAIIMIVDPVGTIDCAGNGVALSATVGGRKGAIILTRTASNSMAIYRGGDQVAISTTAVVNSLPSHTQQIMYSEATTNRFCKVPFNFFSMGSSFTSDQASKFSQIVQDYQTRMGRAV